MKIARLIDVLAQGLMILGALAFSVSIETRLFSMMLVFILGCWQMFGAVYGLIGRAPYRKFRITHLIGSAVYLLVYFNTSVSAELTDIRTWIFIGAAALLAVGYFTITIFNWKRSKHETGTKFLPHINF